jgi:hypothetical protein
MLYRIITEKINNKTTGQPQRTIDLVSKFFSGFTVLYGTGHYKGMEEDCIIFEIETVKAKSEILWLANQIKLQNNQESVLVQQIKSEANFI